MQATITENKAEQTVGELVVERPSRARIFEKLGIDYCCGGRQPLRAACSESGLNYDQVLQQLQAEAAAPAQGERDWSTASLTDLCDHIEQTHHAYLKEELPRLDFLTAKVASRHGDLRQELDYGGYFVAQAGWQWRGGAAMHTFRIGAQYLNGMSPQFEFYNQFEQYFSFGLWYDF